MVELTLNDMVYLCNCNKSRSVSLEGQRLNSTDRRLIGPTNGTRTCIESLVMTQWCDFSQTEIRIPFLLT
jgi:rRNA processing protein Krr1/Pno1